MALLALVSTASLGYFVFSQPDQAGNIANLSSPTPTPTPEPTQTPPTPTPSSREGTTEPASIPKPSVPEFTVKLVDHSYDVPTTYSVDQYTGKTITHYGYHVENKSIEVSIKNQPFTPYTDADGHEVKLYYNIRVKGHYGEDWTAPTSFQGYDPISRIPVYSSSGYTVVTCSASYPADAKVDFQVEAFVGHLYYDSLPDHPLAIFTAFKVDATSGWSNTQTIIIP